MNSGRHTALILLLALAAGIGAWVGVSVIRYGGFKSGIEHLVMESPALQSLVDPGKQQPTQAASTKHLSVGDNIPELALPDAAGTMHPLSEWRGKRVLLNFWATWCAPCLAEMPLFKQLQAAQAKQGLQVIGIGLDDPAKVKNWIQQNPVNFPMLLAGQLDYDITLKFGNSIRAVPYSVLIDRNGKLLRQHTGAFEDATDLREWALAPPL